MLTFNDTCGDTMHERSSELLGLKANYLQHIIGVSSSTVEGRGRAGSPRAGCTCCVVEDGESAPRTAGTSRPPASSPDALVEEVVEMLLPAEKDEVILQMHAKLRQLTDRVEEVIAFSERTLTSLERTHEDALRERLASEQRLRQELHAWRHRHPEVAELREENRRLREEREYSRWEYRVVLGKLARLEKS